jgi:hypothetical protein
VGIGDVTAYLQGLGQAAEQLKHSVKPATQKARDKDILEFQSWIQRAVEVPLPTPLFSIQVTLSLNHYQGELRRNVSGKSDENKGLSAEVPPWVQHATS